MTLLLWLVSMVNTAYSLSAFQDTRLPRRDLLLKLFQYLDRKHHRFPCS
jgi:hypothetical protein